MPPCAASSASAFGRARSGGAAAGCWTSRAATSSAAAAGAQYQMSPSMARIACALSGRTCDGAGRKPGEGSTSGAAPTTAGSVRQTERAAAASAGRRCWLASIGESARGHRRPQQIENALREVCEILCRELRQPGLQGCRSDRCGGRQQLVVFTAAVVAGWPPRAGSAGSCSRLPAGTAGVARPGSPAVPRLGHGGDRTGRGRAPAKCL